MGGNKQKRYDDEFKASVVKMVVEKMNGSISLVSNELGNYFIVKLPIK